MAKEEMILTISVDITGLNVPLMIVVDEKKRVHVYREGREVKNIRQVRFQAGVDRVPTLDMECFA